MTTSIAQPGDDARPEPLRFLGNPLPPWVRRRVVTIAPGDVRPFDEAEWRDALVIVQAGEVALECTRGGRTTFRAGDVLWLVDIPVVRICNDGPIPAVIVAVSRRPVHPQAERDGPFPAVGDEVLIVSPAPRVPVEGTSEGGS